MMKTKVVTTVLAFGVFVSGMVYLDHLSAMEMECKGDGTLIQVEGKELSFYWPQHCNKAPVTHRAWVEDFNRKAEAEREEKQAKLRERYGL